MREMQVPVEMQFCILTLQSSVRQGLSPNLGYPQRTGLLI